MKWTFVLMFAVLNSHSSAQKPALDYPALKSWPEISNGEISSDGRYVSYVVRSDSAGSSLALQAVDGRRSRVFKGCSGPLYFGSDDRYAFVMSGKNILTVFDLQNWKDRIINGVMSFGVPVGGDGRRFAYLSKGHTLVLADLRGGADREYRQVKDFAFNRTGSILLADCEDTANGHKTASLLGIECGQGQVTILWRGRECGNLTFDRSGERIAFTADSLAGGRVVQAIWYWQIGMREAKLEADANRLSPDGGWVLSNRGMTFSPDGRKLFFRLARVPDAPKASSVSVDIWNYRDNYLQGTQKFRWLSQKGRSYDAVLNIGDSNVIRLEPETTPTIILSGDSGMSYAVYTNSDEVNPYKGYRSPENRPSIFIEDTRTGRVRCIKNRVLFAFPSFSTCGRFVYWYSPNERVYYTYEISTGSISRVGKGIPYPLFDEVQSDRTATPGRYGVAGWLPGDTAMLVYDRFDIWRVDPKGMRLPVNCTAGYGRKNHVRLRVVDIAGRGEFKGIQWDSTSGLLLCGFDEDSKENGFFRMAKLGIGVPRKLVMSSSLFYFQDPLEVGLPKLIYKAKNACTYLLTEMSATQYPNWVVTSDFERFKRVTNFEPQKTFNWMTAALWHWQTLTGKIGSAIVYKPEDFDAKKKYPVIFYIYQRLTANLNKFLSPVLSNSDGPINIPWFVSHDYIVVCPDIYYTVGNPLQNVYDYVVSAAHSLGKLPWVDSMKMGIQGHSWGGYEVNGLVTRTHIFAAACSASGVSDLVSMAGAYAPFWGDLFGFIEQEIYQMHSTIWEDPGAYIRNSPIWAADKVETPLLIVADPSDESVPWAQGVEFYTALARLNKRAWMLEYDNEDHTINMPDDQLDFNIRLSQFFDHFLKGYPAPVWMTKGAPASEKGIAGGLEIDSTQLKW